MSKPIYIPPPSKRISGIHVQCRACNALADSGICNKTKKPINAQCPGRDSMCYKAIAHVSGTRNSRKTKILKALSYDEAIAEFLEFKNSLKESQTIDTTPEKIDIDPLSEQVVSKNNRTHELAPLLARYVGFLHNDPQIVPSFRAKPRSKNHLGDAERCILRFITALKQNGRKIDLMCVDEITDEMIDEYLAYLTDDLEVGPAGYNRALTILTSFFTWLTEREGYRIINPFLGIQRKPGKQSVDTISAEQFLQLIEIMKKPELGIRTLSNGVKKNYHKPWGHQLVSLALYSGRRRSECTDIRWKDAVHIDNVLQHIIVADKKINRAKNLPPENWVYHYVPGTKELENLLEEMRSATCDPEGYIVAPKEKMSRDSMARFISKSFAHYFSQLGYEKQLSFGCLRRTYFSALSGAVGMSNAQIISGHTQSSTLRKFYVSKKIVTETAKSFSVFDAANNGRSRNVSDAPNHSESGEGMER